jgi:tRNA U34 5-carboxymethylaminomethyl modifying GTPase MnmE/TrmE
VPLLEEDIAIARMLAGKACIILRNKSDLATAVDDLHMNMLEGIIRRSADEDDTAGTLKGSCTSSRVEGETIQTVDVSALDDSEASRQAIIDLIKKRIFSQGSSTYDEIALTNERQISEMHAAAAALCAFMEAEAAQLPEDILSMDLTDAYSALGRILGEGLDSSVIDMVFERFCVGK